MKIIYPPTIYNPLETEVCCFMAGGMGNIDWQTEFLNYLKLFDFNHLVIFNPYNANITDHAEQVSWEFNCLSLYKNTNFIFSIYFDKYSTQPVSMYELGRMLALKDSKHLSVQLDGVNICGATLNHDFPVVISIHEDAPCKEDILKQCQLVSATAKVRTPKEHAMQVVAKYKFLRQYMKAI